METIQIAEKTIRLHKFYATDGTTKARVHYSFCPGNHMVDGRTCVTIYAKDYSGDLFKIFGDRVQDSTDIQSDYHEKGRVRIYENDPLFAQAKAISG